MLDWKGHISSRRRPYINTIRHYVSDSNI